MSKEKRDSNIHLIEPIVKPTAPRSNRWNRDRWIGVANTGFILSAGVGCALSIIHLSQGRYEQLPLDMVFLVASVSLTIIASNKHTRKTS